MKNYAVLFLLLIFFSVCSCRSINTDRTEHGIPQYVVYFTFDDGPNALGETTGRLLDVLEKYRIKAMFCLLGENVEVNQELTRRIYDEGHYIASHGYRDKWARRMNDDEFIDNLARAREAISSAIGRDMYPLLYRPHGGFYSSRQEKIFLEAGYTMVPGNIRIYDASLTGADRDKAVKRLIKKTEKQGGGIILLHDGRDSYSRMERELAKKPEGVFDRSWIPEFVEDVIIELLSRGFILDDENILAAIGFGD